MISILCQSTQFVDDLFLAGQDFVARRPTVIRVNAHTMYKLRARIDSSLLDQFTSGQLLGRGGLAGSILGVFLGTPHGQVADVSDAGLHHEILPQVAIDRLRLGG